MSNGIISRRQFTEPIGNLAVLKQETWQCPYQIQIAGPGPYFSYQQFEEKVLQEELAVALGAFGRVESRPENRVYLDPDERDGYGVPMIQVNFSYSSRDLMVINEMHRGLIQTASAMGVALDGAPVLLPPGSDYHESCTCRMGTEADNSVLPTLAAANPTLTTVALAIRTADHIVRQSG